MANQITCPNCGQHYDLTIEQVPQYAGQTITCTQCQKPFTVPASIGTPSPAQPAHATDRAPAHVPYGQPQQTRYMEAEAQ